MEEVEGPAKVGMPYAFSSMSASVTLVGPPLGRAGDAVLGIAGADSLREFGESSLFDQGAIGVLSIVACSLQVAQRLLTVH